MKSRNRGKKQQKIGSNKHGLSLSSDDLFYKNEAYKSKYSEYTEMELSELELLKGSVGGIYETALIDVIKEKS